MLVGLYSVSKNEKKKEKKEKETAVHYHSSRTAQKRISTTSGWLCAYAPSKHTLVTLPSIILVFSVGFVGFWVKKS